MPILWVLPSAIGALGQESNIFQGGAMYSFTEEQENSIISMAEGLLGQDYKYGELCDKLGINRVSGKTNKAKQFRDLANLLIIKNIPFGKQNKYRIIDIRDEPLLPYYDRDEWYWSFKTTICQILAKNQYQPVWFTRTPLLNKIGMVNDNYSVIMSKDKRATLEMIYSRPFEQEYEACKVMGNLLADRVYNALHKMEQERIIKYFDGYAIRIVKDFTTSFIPISSSDQDRGTVLYQILFSIENQAIDNICNQVGWKKPSDGAFVNRTAIKQIYFYQILEERNRLINRPENIDKLKALGLQFDSIEEFYDIKFIIPDMRLAEEITRSRRKAKKILNLAAQDKILNSKSQVLAKYETIKAGLVDVCIDDKSKTNYKELVDGKETL